MEIEPEIDEREVLDKFFAACDEEERLIFETFLYSGFRKNEIAPLHDERYFVRRLHNQDVAQRT
jgi:hypothetical protein